MDAERLASRSLLSGLWPWAAGLLALAAVLSAPAARAETAAEAFSAADSLFQRGAYEEALAGYRDFTARFPDDWRAPQARFTAAFVLLKKLGQPVKAREEYEGVIKHDDAGPLARNAQFHIAEAYEQSGDTQQAISAYTAFLKRAGRHPRALGANRKLDVLDRKARGVAPEEQPGWAYKIERKLWRKSQLPGDTPPEKHPRGKGGPGKANKLRPGDAGATGDAPPPVQPAPSKDTKEPARE